MRGACGGLRTAATRAVPAWTGADGVNRLALRLGLYGGFLAFTTSALVMFTADPQFVQRTPAQLLQISLIWFGFSALLGSVVGWGVFAAWSHRPVGVGEAQPSAAIASPLVGANQASQAYSASATRPAAEAEPEPEFEEGASGIFETIPPESTAQVIRGTLQNEQ